MPYSDPAKKQAYQKSYNVSITDATRFARISSIKPSILNKTFGLRNAIHLGPFGNTCCRCGFDDNLRVVPRDPSRRSVWTARGSSGSDTPRYILDYSWDSLNDILPTLDLLCENCRNPKTPKTTAELAEKLSGLGSTESNLPRGYVLDEDLENL